MSANNQVIEIMLVCVTHAGLYKPYLFLDVNKHTEAFTGSIPINSSRNYNLGAESDMIHLTSQLYAK